MRTAKHWNRERSDHARVLEGLEAAIAAHPSSSSRRRARRGRRRVAEPSGRIVVPLFAVTDLERHRARRAGRRIEGGRGPDAA